MTREEKVEQAERLRAEGLSYRAIGERLDVTNSTVLRWLNPSKGEQYDKNRRERNANNPEYRAKEKQRQKCRNYELLQQVHPEVTYIVGSPDCSRVVIGKTTNWESRKKNGYNKSLFPLRLLAMTRIPEKAIHDKFRHLRAPGYSPEVFELTPELQGFIDSCWPIFDGECFRG